MDFWVTILGFFLLLVQQGGPRGNRGIRDEFACLVTDIFNAKIAYLQQIRCVLEIMHWEDAYLTTYFAIELLSTDSLIRLFLSDQNE